MSNDEDYLYALRLQNELNAEEEALVEVSSFYFFSFLFIWIMLCTQKINVNGKWFWLFSGPLVKHAVTSAETMMTTIWMPHKISWIQNGKQLIRRQTFFHCSGHSISSFSKANWNVLNWNGANGCISAREFAINVEMVWECQSSFGSVNRCWSFEAAEI